MQAASRARVHPAEEGDAIQTGMPRRPPRLEPAEEADSKHMANAGNQSGSGGGDSCTSGTSTSSTSSSSSDLDGEVQIDLDALLTFDAATFSVAEAADMIGELRRAGVPGRTSKWVADDDGTFASTLRAIASEASGGHEAKQARALAFVRDALAARFEFGLGAYAQSFGARFIELADSWSYVIVLHALIVIYIAMGALALPPGPRPDGDPAFEYSPGVEGVLSQIGIVCGVLLALDVLVEVFLLFKSPLYSYRDGFGLGSVRGWLRRLRQVPVMSWARLVLCLVLLADAAQAPSTNARGWPIVRAGRSLLLLRSAFLRDTAWAVVGVLPAAGLVFAFIFFIVLIYSILFSQLYGSFGPPPAPGPCASQLGPFYSGYVNFDTVAAGMRSLFLAMYTDNFPDIARPAAKRDGYVAWILFISFVCVAGILALNVVVSTVFTLYREVLASETRRTYRIKVKALLAAFALLATPPSRSDGAPQLRKTHWTELMQALLKHHTGVHVSAEALEPFFNRVDENASEQLDEAEFAAMMAQLDEGLGQARLFGSAAPLVVAAVPAATSRCTSPLYYRAVSLARRLARRPWFDRLLNLLLVFNVVLYGLQGSRSAAGVLTRQFGRINFALSVVFFVEVFVKLLAAPRRFWANAWHRFDLCVVVVLNGCGWLAYGLFLLFSDANDCRRDTLRRVALAIGALRVFRLVRLIQPFQTFLSTLIYSAKRMGRFVLLLLIAMYIFAIIGVDSFAFKQVNNFNNLSVHQPSRTRRSHAR